MKKFRHYLDIPTLTELCEKKASLPEMAEYFKVSVRVLQQHIEFNKIPYDLPKPKPKTRTQIDEELLREYCAAKKSKEFLEEQFGCNIRVIMNRIKELKIEYKVRKKKNPNKNNVTSTSELITDSNGTQKAATPPRDYMGMVAQMDRMIVAAKSFSVALLELRDLIACETKIPPVSAELYEKHVNQKISTATLATECGISDKAVKSRIEKYKKKLARLKLKNT